MLSHFLFTNQFKTMKFQFHISLLLLTCATNYEAYAQNPFDCIDALVVCDKSNFAVNYFEAVEGSIDEGITDVCGQDFNNFFDNNTIWLKYQFVSDGDFLFTIIPSMEAQDIDFVVFKSDSNSCDDLVPIRCMFTGASYPGPIDPLCSGPTGLSADSEDLFETAGCNLGDDNFLAPVEAMTGDILYLAILDFSVINNYMIEYGGSAEISCMPLTTDELGAEEVKIYPNPSKGLFHIEVDNNDHQVFEVELLNTAGAIVQKQSFYGNISLDIQDLPKGIYYAKIRSDQLFYFYQKLIKI